MKKTADSHTARLWNNTLNHLGLDLSAYEGGSLRVHSPIDGTLVAKLAADTPQQVKQKIARAAKAFDVWRLVPAPRRGELIRLLGEELRTHKDALGQLVSLECGKVLEEGKGEVQEMIDICDFAVGLSRTISGLTLPSERPEHVMHENWLPLGPVGVISAFNFPVAVWAWNFALAVICGDSVLWKPSEKTPVTALACEVLWNNALRRFGPAPKHLLEIIIGTAEAGEALVADARVPLISATGSCRMGALVAPVVSKRFGRCLLELGGNNAVIVTPSASLDIALPSIVFGAVGTAGQRCTTTRRVFAHRSIYKNLCTRLQRAYGSIEHRIGSPLEPGTLVGPLMDEHAFLAMQKALKSAKKAGGKLLSGGNRVLKDRFPKGVYVSPALVQIESQSAIVCQETFAPILYVMPYDSLEEAMKLHNAVPQGLSSAIFTQDLREAEYFKHHSDCGIANVNIGTSGAEIGGAFGGEKETGGGRESGSDAWKIYMRRQTSTTYYGSKPPALAQGIKFDLK